MTESAIYRHGVHHRTLSDPPATKVATGEGGERAEPRALVIIASCVAWMAAAELSLVVGSLTTNPAWYSIGIVTDLSLIAVLLAQATQLRTKNPPLSSFLLALVLCPIVRVASLSAPFAPFPPLTFLLIVAFALLLGVASVAVALRLSPADLYLRIGSPTSLVTNIAIGLGGLGLGFVEFVILRPVPWIGTLTLGNLAFAAFVVFLSTGIAEELIFRGAIMRTAERLLGANRGLLIATVVFSILHIGFLSPLDLAFVFVAGLYFGVAVQKTGSLYGAILAHTLANTMLYLVLPFVA